ncbi:Lrp/AsnC family transcriptional regulator [Halapricum desulfuricans]|uniref:Lrp/AsnC family C-terminal domain n=1 Tax=Halapricum desulfuricans TaxID=2841257 RepID=A0A897NAT5_9EURY|nr:Lrp/AsnC ligand binding domain-containing protein [Halapricum desulfuricans]QSG09498.1 Lrp/AsnC family C-terminal domain [Halapricum desulfuricans]
MVRAFVMIKTAAGKSEELLASIGAVTGVEEAHIVAGQYDIIAETDGEDVYEVMQSVSGEIRGLDGVSDTRTYISLE